MNSDKIPPNIDIIDQDRPANVATEFHVMHTPNEFLVTIIEVIPQMQYKIPEFPNESGRRLPRLQNTGIIHKVVGRFGMSPSTFKKLVQVTSQNLIQFEKKYGEVAINPPEGMQ